MVVEAGIQLSHTDHNGNGVRASDASNSSTSSLDDRNWSWYFLRKQFKIRNLEGLYSQYQQRLHRGYFSVYLLLQMILSLTHAAILLASDVDDPHHRSLPDITAYIVVALALWPLVALVFKQRLVRKHQWLPLLVSVTAVVTLVSVDLGLPIYHAAMFHSRTPLRPAYATHALLACYIFLPLQDNIAPVVLGLAVTLSHLTTMALVTYRDSVSFSRQIASDTVYLLCVNALGLYFRFVNEVVIRRTFLDRRACVESTLKLNYEKEQEEQLMLSILPRHIASRVREDIRRQVLESGNVDDPIAQNPFNELYVEEHENVSILYADVVNYTQMTSSLPVNKLVETLNELFGRFDEASENHKVLRIKFLGDCYYCVAGVPQPNPDHARSCVDLGLDMISIIREVREKRKLDIDMRIGVHSGNILSGLLGRCKWQYDVWSKDVIIANHMEQSGQPGKVHVTKQTLNQLGEDYDTVPSNGHIKDDILAKHNIETYLIEPKKESLEQQSVESRSALYLRRASVKVARVSRREMNMLSSISSEGNLAISRRRTAFMDNNLVMYQQRLKMADVHMAKAIEKLPLGKYDQWFHKEQIHPLCLTFQSEGSWEIPFLKQPDPLFKFYIGSALVVLMCVLVIELLGLPKWDWPAWLGFLVSGGLLATLVPLTWAHFTWNAWQDPHQELDHVPEPCNKVLRVLYDGSLRIVWSACIRTLLYVLVCALLALCAMADMIKCADDEGSDCAGPWQMTEKCSLAVIMSFLFLRIHFQLKLLVGLLILGMYTFCITLLQAVFASGDTWNPDLDPKIAHILNIVFLVVGLHLMDRQAEYMNRLDYRWKRQLSDEKDEAAMTRIVNKKLLQNILPIHVAEVYLNTNRASDELYHENYDSVAVMFASLTNYSLYDETDRSSSELRSLKILNQIICDFDNMLRKKPYTRVEKIKVAGWTYMAACGLDPGRRESNSSSVPSGKPPSYKHFVLTMARFAADMMRTLRNINKESSENFKLRIGIAHGPITAGVVGSQKPLYDIWGNAVNMSSRMDSTGEPGKIQVIEETAKVLYEQGVECQLRGPTFVKGKGMIPTYYLSLTEECYLREGVRHCQSPPPSENTRL